MIEPRFGMGGRFFPSNWRPPSVEIQFAADAGFSSLQFRSDEPGDLPEVLRMPLDEVARALTDTELDATIELLVRIDDAGHTRDGITLPQALDRSLLAITALSCDTVHIHAVGPANLTPDQHRSMTSTVVDALATCVDIATRHGVQFGFEHNAPGSVPFADLSECQVALQQVPDLGFVWDTNHTPADDHLRIASFLERTIAVHVSDTMLPRTNDHLPIGSGTVDFSALVGALASGRLACPVTLEIGGLPHSGGHGRDTDDALIDSLTHLRQMVRGQSAT